jgi:hypothetical protein
MLPPEGLTTRGFGIMDSLPMGSDMLRATFNGKGITERADVIGVASEAPRLIAGTDRLPNPKDAGVTSEAPRLIAGTDTFCKVAGVASEAPRLITGTDMLPKVVAPMEGATMRGFGIIEDGAIGTEMLRGCTLLSIVDGDTTPALAKTVSTTGAEIGAIGLIGTVMLPWTGAMVWTEGLGRTAGAAAALTVAIVFNLGGPRLLGSGTV